MRKPIDLILRLFLACAFPLAFAVSAADFSVEFPIGNGTQEFTATTADETLPAFGPTAILPNAGGCSILDAAKARLTHLDAQGKNPVSVPLATEGFNDLAVTGDGAVFLPNVESRQVLRVTGTATAVAFSVPTTDGYPTGFDHVILTGDRLVIGDFTTMKLYVFTLAGALETSFSMPRIVGLAPGPDGSIAFLAPRDAESEPYDHLTLVDLKGKEIRKTPVLGKDLGAYLGSTRLLGFTTDLRAIALGWSDQQESDTALIAIAPDGTGSILGRFPLVAGATRYGGLRGDTLWLNLTPTTGKKAVFRCVDCSRKP